MVRRLTILMFGLLVLAACQGFRLNGDEADGRVTGGAPKVPPTFAFGYLNNVNRFQNGGKTVFAGNVFLKDFEEGDKVYVVVGTGDENKPPKCPPDAPQIQQTASFIQKGFIEVDTAGSPGTFTIELNNIDSDEEPFLYVVSEMPEAENNDSRVTFEAWYLNEEEYDGPGVLAFFEPGEEEIYCINEGNL